MFFQCEDHFSINDMGIVVSKFQNSQCNFYCMIAVHHTILETEIQFNFKILNSQFQRINIEFMYSVSVFTGKKVCKPNDITAFEFENFLFN